MKNDPENMLDDKPVKGDTETRAITELPVTVDAKYRIWSMACPFTKKGYPNVGSFGSTIRNVVIFDVKTWTRLCKDVPQLQTTMFEVGTLD